MTINEIRLQAANAGSSSINISGKDLLAILNSIPTPDGVKVYRAILNQTSTNAPTATVLENSLGGTLVWSYNGVGAYDATLSGVFTASKVLFYAANGLTGSGAMISGARLDNNVLSVYTFNVADGQANDILSDASIEILVYP